MRYVGWLAVATLMASCLWGGDRLWVNDAGAILREEAGPAHCEWQDVRFLRIPDGAVTHQYVGDPLGVMRAGEIDEPYNGDAGLPADATASGYRSGDLELWFVPDGRAVFVVGQDRVELWPRSGAGCI
jgi:hypothetical protein